MHPRTVKISGLPLLFLLQQTVSSDTWSLCCAATTERCSFIVKMLHEENLGFQTRPTVRKNWEPFSHSLRANALTAFQIGSRTPPSTSLRINYSLFIHSCNTATYNTNHWHCRYLKCKEDLKIKKYNPLFLQIASHPCHITPLSHHTPVTSHPCHITPLSHYTNRLGRKR